MLGLSQLIAFILLPCLAFLVTSTLFELIVTILLPCVVVGSPSKVWVLLNNLQRGVCTFFQIAQIETTCYMNFDVLPFIFKGKTY